MRFYQFIKATSKVLSAFERQTLTYEVTGATF